MIGGFVEKNKKTVIAILSGFILFGSGISLGTGLNELKVQPNSVQFSGLEEIEPGEIASSSVEEKQFPININTASAIDLELLPGIGPSKAQAIVDYRETYGKFKAISEIDNVSGIGPATFERLKALITVK